MNPLNEQIVKRISLNDSNECLICITRNCLRIFNTTPLREISEIDISTFGSIYLCEMVGRRNLLALVTSKDSNIFQLYDDNKKKIKMRLTFNQRICGIRFRRNILGIILRSETYIYKLNYQGSLLRKPTLLLNFATFDNHMGLCDITRSDVSPMQIIVTPFMKKKGSVQMMYIRIDKEYVYMTKEFVAHKTNLSSLTLNYNGNLLATTSERGTIIRIWDCNSNIKITEFRRGTNPAIIYSTCFSQDSQYICCTSDKGTVHIFSMNKIVSKGLNLAKIRAFADADRSVATFATNSECIFICGFVGSEKLIALGLNGTYRLYTVKDDKCTFKEYEEFLQLCANVEND